MYIREYTQHFQHLLIQLHTPITRKIDLTVCRKVNDNLKSDSKCCWLEYKSCHTKMMSCNPMPKAVSWKREH